MELAAAARFCVRGGDGGRMPGQRAMGRGVGEGRRKAPAPDGEEPLFRESPPPLPFPGEEGRRNKF